MMVEVAQADIRRRHARTGIVALSTEEKKKMANRVHGKIVPQSNRTSHCQAACAVTIAASSICVPPATVAFSQPFERGHSQRTSRGQCNSEAAIVL